MFIGRRFFVIAAVAATLLLPTQARAATEYFRYSVSTYEPGPPKYTGKLSSMKTKGQVYAVDRDARGRITSVAVYRDGKKLTESIYTYTGAAKLSSGYKFYRAGSLEESGVYKRDASGQVSRADYYTAQGALTGYWVGTHVPGEIDGTSYSDKGVVTSHSQSFYNPKGVLVREKYYETADNSVYYETQYDVASGLSTSQAKWEKGKKVTDEHYSHDSYGDLTRIDVFDPETNKPYGRKEYADGLRRKDFYNFTNGTTKEIDYVYDSQRILSSAKMLANGTLVCTFTFDRLPDGTVKRTLATGADGQLWAEYPNAMVTNVYDDGSSVDNKPGTIYKTGKWY